MTIKRTLAKLLFHLSGWLRVVKTYQRWYTLESFDPPRFVLGGWHWFDCNLSTWLMHLSMQLDWDHWDHWACVHDQCSPRQCLTCKGMECADEGVNT